MFTNAWHVLSLSEGDGPEVERHNIQTVGISSLVMLVGWVQIYLGLIGSRGRFPLISLVSFCLYIFINFLRC